MSNSVCQHQNPAYEVIENGPRNQEVSHPITRDSNKVHRPFRISCVLDDAPLHFSTDTIRFDICCSILLVVVVQVNPSGVGVYLSTVTIQI